jgi:hypothetical protein
MHWYGVSKRDPTAAAIFGRHYTARPTRPSGCNQFVGPGETMVLLTANADALFVWRKFIDHSGIEGVNCAVFRNEGPLLSSQLILEAETLARARWPGQLFYTFVNPAKVRSTNPGYCFLRAGWKRSGFTAKRHLLILTKEATPWAATSQSPKSSSSSSKK